MVYEHTYRYYFVNLQQKKTGIMIELKEKASIYAEENVINVLKEAFAKVYADGYRDGYNDCQKENAIDLQDDETEFVDLGLPSGILWSSDYKKNNDSLLYLSYEEALELNVPTNNQCWELFNNCMFTFEDNQMCCIGPNGNYLTFCFTGYKEMDSPKFSEIVYFWAKNDNGVDSKAWAAAMGRDSKLWRDTRVMFKGYKLPIRLVKTK